MGLVLSSNAQYYRLTIWSQLKLQFWILQIRAPQGWQCMIWPWPLDQGEIWHRSWVLHIQFRIGGLYIWEFITGPDKLLHVIQFIFIALQCKMSKSALEWPWWGSDWPDIWGSESLIWNISLKDTQPFGHGPKICVPNSLDFNLCNHENWVKFIVITKARFWWTVPMMLMM